MTEFDLVELREQVEYLKARVRALELRQNIGPLNNRDQIRIEAEAKNARMMDNG